MSQEMIEEVCNTFNTFSKQIIEYEDDKVWNQVLNPRDRLVISNSFSFPSQASPDTVFVTEEMYHELLEWPLVVGDCVMPDIRTKEYKEK